MVLYALQQLGGIRCKQEVLRFIREHRFYDLQEEDMERYDGCNEWIGDTLLCLLAKMRLRMNGCLITMKMTAGN